MITLYHVFPGIDLVYNDMHMEYCNKEQKPASSVMEINYCMEGRWDVYKRQVLGFDDLWTDYLQPLLQDYVRGLNDEEDVYKRQDTGRYTVDYL